MQRSFTIPSVHARSFGLEHASDGDVHGHRARWLRWALAVVVVLLLARTAASGGPIISEFMAANASTVADDDGAYSDWIEIFNPDGEPVELGGWFLTDSASNRKKWAFPQVTLPPGGYLLVWASNKNRRDPTKPLHTNFALSAGGEYLGLIEPDGVTAASEYAPTFPAQRDNVSYGTSQAPGPDEVGFFIAPTPGTRNGSATQSALSETVTFSRGSGPFNGSFTLQLTGARPGQRIRYVLAAPSIAGFIVPAPTAASPEYREALTITKSTAVRAAVFSSDNALSGPVAMAHYVLLDPAVASFTSEMPVLILDNHGFGPLTKDGIDHPSWLYLFEPRGTGVPTFGTAPDIASPLTSSVRGQSASEFPKKSYNLKFTDEAGRKREQSLHGSAPYEKWALVSPWFYDRTFISNALAYALSNAVGRWAPRTHLVEVYFNTSDTLDARAYYGVAVLTDRIEVAPGRVDISPLSASDLAFPAITGGYIVKIDVRDDDEYGFVTERGEPTDPDAMVVVAYPKDADLAPEQRAYIREHIQAMENALHADAAGGWASRTHLDYIDRASWVDHHLLNTLAANPDAFRRSAYFTNDRAAPLVAGPVWDFDRAFNSCDERNFGPEGWRGEVGSSSVWDIGWWRVLVRDPEFIQEWIDRWQTLRQGPLADAAVIARIDALAAQVGGAAAARDAAKWPADASRFGDYTGEIRELKEWITRRAAWIDGQFLTPPSLALQGDTIRVTAAPGTVLAYTLDGSDPRSVGGAIAPNALLSTQPVVIAAGAHLHARSYAGALEMSFPATPWSSAIGTRDASPLRPQARLINVSARAMVTPPSNLSIGMVLADTSEKQILVRGVGPGLAPFCASQTLPDSEVVLSPSAEPGRTICRSADWEANGDGRMLADLFASRGAFPFSPGSRDAAAMAALGQGTYTLRLSSPSGVAGIGLAELYELDARGRMKALSARGQVQAGDGLLVAGFVVQGPASQRVLLRVTMPDTMDGRVLRDGALSLYAGADLLASNEHWSAAANAAQIEAAGHALRLEFLRGGPDEPAAIFAVLPAGVYTAVVESRSGAGGLAVLEVREVP